MTPIQNPPTSHPFLGPHLPDPVSLLIWTSAVASSQVSQLHPLPPSLFSPPQPKQQSKNACGHLSVVASLLCLDPSMAPTVFIVEA